MLSPSGFRDLVSGRRRSGRGEHHAAGRMRVGEWFYTAAVRWRNRRFDRGTAKVFRVDVPVVSVGNLTLGGTGKTPLVEWLARWFGREGVHVALVSRGYGGKKGTVPICAKHPSGRSGGHRPKVGRGLSPFSRPTTRPWNYGCRCRRCRTCRIRIAWPPPGRPFGSSVAGPSCWTTVFNTAASAATWTSCCWTPWNRSASATSFRAGRSASRSKGCEQADVVALSRADLLDERGRAELWRIVDAYAPQAIRAEMVHAPRTLVSATGQQMPLDALRGQSVAAFCGIGNPAGFRHTLSACGVRIADFREFPDHHRYTAADRGSLADWAERLGALAVLCTRKDLVKLSADSLGGRPLWAVGIELEFLAGQEALEARLSGLLAS